MDLTLSILYTYNELLIIIKIFSNFNRESNNLQNSLIDNLARLVMMPIIVSSVNYSFFLIQVQIATSSFRDILMIYLTII